MIRVTTSLLLLLSGFSLLSQDGLTSEFSNVCKAGSTLYVYTRSGLILRSKPDINGAAIGKAGYGSKVVVVADAGQRVAFKNGNIQGEWVKVKWGDKEGYIFSGYLSRWPAMTIDLASYLKQIFLVKSETTEAPDTVLVFLYEKITFQNGSIYLSKTGDGGSSVRVTFPAFTMTFQEMYLLARIANSEFFLAPAKCDYNENGMNCEVGEEVSNGHMFPASGLFLTKEDGNCVMYWGRGPD